MVRIHGIWSAETARVKRISFTAFLLSHGVSRDPLVGCTFVFLFTYTLYILSSRSNVLFRTKSCEFSLHTLSSNSKTYYFTTKSYEYQFDYEGT
jgi:hypothetical protein